MNFKNSVRYLVTGVALISLLCSCVETQALPPEGNKPPVQNLNFCSGLTLGSGDYSNVLSSGGIDRNYRLHIPKSYKSTNITPIVFSFHGGGANAEQMEQMTQMVAQSELGGFILVEPNGTSPSGGDGTHQTWNAGTCCGYASENKIDDVAFVKALIERVSQMTCVDTKRIYATGFSNGAMMAQRLGCELSDRIAAIAPVSGGLQNREFPNDPTPSPFSCDVKGSVSVLELHGVPKVALKGDSCVPFDGGYGGLTPETYKPSIPYAISTWRAINSCDPNLTISYQQGTSAGAVVCRTYSGCKNGTAVTSCEIAGGGHWWPGSPEPYPAFLFGLCGGIKSQQIDASAAIWDFFKNHPKP